MAYSEELADRIRDLLADRGELTERKMFGGSRSCSTATWPDVELAGIETDEQLAGWVDAAAGYALSLPPK